MNTRRRRRPVIRLGTSIPSFVLVEGRNTLNVKFPPSFCYLSMSLFILYQVHNYLRFFFLLRSPVVSYFRAKVHSLTPSGVAVAPYLWTCFRPSLRTRSNHVHSFFLLRGIDSVSLFPVYFVPSLVDIYPRVSPTLLGVM